MTEGTGGAVAAALSTAAAAVEEAEIDAMAAKMRHDNQRFMQQQQSSSSSLPSGPVTLARPGQPAIAQYFGGGTAAAAPVKPTSAAVAGAESSKSSPALDEESRRGRFGWFSLQQAGQPPYIPYLLRYKTDPYASVRMVERVLNRYLQLLPPEVNSCTSIHSYYITEIENQLLNDINRSHSDGTFGTFTSRDLVVAKKEVEQFHAFLDLCHRKLVLKKSRSSDRCGFYRINGESVVPYTVRGEARFIPLFYFEGETDKVQLNSCLAEGWDLSYLKFCFKVQGIRGDLYQGESCKVVSLADIQSHFPADTTFEDYWPAQGSIGPVNTSRQSTSAGNWTQKPASGQQPSQLPSLANLNLGIRPQQPQQPQQASHQSTAQVQTQGGVRGYFSGKLTRIKEFPIEAGPKELPPYRVQKALIDSQMVACVNVRPFSFNGDLMMTLGDLLGGFFPQQRIEKILQLLESFKVVLYEGNSGHQAVLRREGMYRLHDPAPLVLIKSVMDLMPQMKFLLSTNPPSEKRQRVE